MTRFLRIVLIVAVFATSCSSSLPTANTALPETATEIPTAEPTPTPTPTPTTTPITTLVDSTCPEKFLGIDRFTCQTLTVPETHGLDNGRTIDVPLLTIAAENPNGEPPVLFLPGGPGNSGMDQAFGTIDTAWADGRALILTETRGAGYATPSLTCPEILDAYTTIFTTADPASDEANLADAAQACHDRLVNEDVNLDAYNTTEAALDLVDLRIALGVDEWDVVGPSYGGLLALHFSRTPGNEIHAMVLDSPVPPTVSQGGSEVANRSASVFQRLAEACQRDETCGAKHPDLVGEIVTTVSRLNATPMTIAQGDDPPLIITGNDLYALLYFAMYRGDLAPTLPDAITAIDAFGPPLLGAIVPGVLGSFNAIATGMSLSVTCSDRANLEPVDSFNQTRLDHPENATLWGFFPTPEICEIWDVAPASESFRQPVTESVPTLVLIGGLDPIADPFHSNEIADQLVNGLAVEFPGIGHGVLGSGDCVNEIVTQFTADPTTVSIECAQLVVAGF